MSSCGFLVLKFSYNPSIASILLFFDCMVFSFNIPPQLSSHALLFPVDLTHTSVPSSLFGSDIPPLSSNMSSSSDDFSTTFLEKASLTLASNNFHHFINFLPIDCLCFDSLHAFLPPVGATLCCEVTAFYGIVPCRFGFPYLFFSNQILVYFHLCSI